MQNSKTIVNAFGAPILYYVFMLQSLILLGLTSLILSIIHGNLQFFPSLLHRWCHDFPSVSVIILGSEGNEEGLCQGCRSKRRGEPHDHLAPLYTQLIKSFFIHCLFCPHNNISYFLLPTPFVGCLLCARTWDTQDWNNLYLGFGQSGGRKK